MKIQLTKSELDTLKQMYLDFDSGWIANHGARAQKVRDKYQKLINQIIDAANSGIGERLNQRTKEGSV